MTDQETPILAVRELKKSYGSGSAEVHALRGVSFEIERGQTVALTGPSGCGKTTLLHLVGGMDHPTSGSVLLAGRDMANMNEVELARTRRCQLGFVFQFFNLLPTLSVIENVALPLILNGTSRREAHDRAVEMLAEVDLDHRRDHDPNLLSGGEMQRAAIARALIGKPSLVLADEPTGSLDTQNGARVMQIFRSLNEQLDVTMIIATHSPEVASYCKKTIAIRDGKIEEPPT